jgi:hypothetical protein
MNARLLSLGDTLEHAATRSLRRRRWRRAGALGLVVVAAGAWGGATLISTDDVAASLPAGTKMLVGTSPSCTVVRANVEYDCTLPQPVHGEVADLKGTVEPTVDASKHVNGGCRSLRSDGREWRCYIGEEAVRQQIIGAGFLGQFAPAPGVG